MTRSHLYCRCTCGRFSQRRKLPDAAWWHLCFSSFCHCLPPWSHHRHEWLPYQRPWHVTTKKPKERPRTWWASSTTYTKVWPLSVECTSIARGISLDNHLHKWRAHSLLERTAYSVWLPICELVASFYIFPTVPACWVCCRCCVYMRHCFRKKTTTITQCKLLKNIESNHHYP